MELIQLGIFLAVVIFAADREDELAKQPTDSTLSSQTWSQATYFTIQFFCCELQEGTLSFYGVRPVDAKSIPTAHFDLVY